MLNNELYGGTYVWSKTEKYHTSKRTKLQRKQRDPKKLVTVQMPHLRIVDEDLWRSTRKRLEAVR